MARNELAAPRFADYFTIGEAAEFLGVSAATLRNWDRSGKLRPRRHPQNGYRIYLHDDLTAVLQSAGKSSANRELAGSNVDWTAIHGADHFVQFYESDDYFVEAACGFIGAALQNDEIGIVVASLEHRQAIERRLVELGFDVGSAKVRGNYLAQDAHETLSQFMVGDEIDDDRFDAAIGQTVVQLAAHGRHIHAFGEMVTILWEQGNQAAAIALEQKWSVLAERHQLALLCGYPISAFNADVKGVQFDDLCACHTHILPTESYGRIAGDGARLHAVSKLQQQVHALRAELQHRKEVERALTSDKSGSKLSN